LLRSPLGHSGHGLCVCLGHSRRSGSRKYPGHSERAALDTLRAAGYAIAASVPRDGADLFTADLPPRLVLVFGAEGEGMSAPLIAASDLRLTIPGSGAVESLNIAVSAAIFLAEYRRRHSLRG
jgi:TrmH RNA methyltransferase